MLARFFKATAKPAPAKPAAKPAVKSAPRVSERYGVFASDEGGEYMVSPKKKRFLVKSDDNNFYVETDTGTEKRYTKVPEGHFKKQETAFNKYTGKTEVVRDYDSPEQYAASLLSRGGYSLRKQQTQYSFNDFTEPVDTRTGKAYAGKKYHTAVEPRSRKMVQADTQRQTQDQIHAYMNDPVLKEKSRAASAPPPPPSPPPVNDPANFSAFKVNTKSSKTATADPNYKPPVNDPANFGAFRVSTKASKPTPSSQSKPISYNPDVWKNFNQPRPDPVVDTATQEVKPEPEAVVKTPKPKKKKATVNSGKAKS
jgi:hypothetical protein